METEHAGRPRKGVWRRTPRGHRWEQEGPGSVCGMGENRGVGGWGWGRSQRRGEEGMSVDVHGGVGVGGGVGERDTR